MQLAAQFSLFLAAAYGLSLMLWAVLRFRPRGQPLAISVSALIMSSPLLISAPYVGARALACVLAIDLFFKTTDYATQRAQGTVRDMGWRTYASFLIPFPVFLVRFGQRVYGKPVSTDGRREAAVTLLVFALCLVGVLQTAATGPFRSSFLLDHTVKFVAFAVAIEAFARFIQHLERLWGFDVPPLIDHAWLSRTVGEFWSRYNIRVHDWFEHNVFRPSGGRRYPVRGVFLTFFVSGVLHEIGFAIATSRIDGYQFAFFMLQAPAVVVSRVAERSLPGGAVGWARSVTTILWMWLTSMLFFHGVNRVFPFFYACEPWLP